MKATKKSLNYLIIFCLLPVIALSLSILLITDSANAAAFTNDVDIENLNELCEEFTTSPLLQGESEGGKLITDYEDYINERFQVTNKLNDNPNVTDEWIFKIVPIQLFEQQKQKFLYVGENTDFILIISMATYSNYKK